jgi:hypothetical protein
VVLEDAVATPNALLHEGSLNFFRARYPIFNCETVLTAIQTAKQKALA